VSYGLRILQKVAAIQPTYYPIRFVFKRVESMLLQKSLCEG